MKDATQTGFSEAEVSDACHSASDQSASHIRPDSERACDGLESGDAGGPLMGVDDEKDEMNKILWTKWRETRQMKG